MTVFCPTADKDLGWRSDGEERLFSDNVLQFCDQGGAVGIGNTAQLFDDKAFLHGGQNRLDDGWF